jgi:hypothetical protein
MKQSEYGDENLMEEIIGEQLSGVTFVMDYVQLLFNSNWINAICGLQVVKGGIVSQWGDAEYRDRLCERITHTVIKAQARKGDAVKIVFDDGYSIVIPVRDEDHIYGPECVIYQGSENWWVL